MPRGKQNDMDLGSEPGVAPVRYKNIDRLGDRFIDIRDQKAELASELGKIEAQIAEAMAEHGLEKYHFSDQEVIVKKGKLKVKIKTVKSESPEDEIVE